MSKKYLDNNNQTPTLPLMSALWTAASLKIFEAPEWLWGVFGVLYFIGFVVMLVKVFTYEKTEL
jgi:hypothetical protein